MADAPENVATLGAPLTLQRMAQLREELEAEVERLAKSLEALTQAKARFEASKSNLTKLHESEDKKMMVPMTTSVYQRGELADQNRFIIDVGAGYFIERNFEACQKYFGERVKAVGSEAEKLASLLQSRQNTLEIFSLQLQSRVAASSLTANA